MANKFCLPLPLSLWPRHPAVGMTIEDANRGSPEQLHWCCSWPTLPALALPLGAPTDGHYHPRSCLAAHSQSMIPVERSHCHVLLGNQAFKCNYLNTPSFDGVLHGHTTVPEGGPVNLVVVHVNCSVVPHQAWIRFQNGAGEGIEPGDDTGTVGSTRPNRDPVVAGRLQACTGEDEIPKVLKTNS